MRAAERLEAIEAEEALRKKPLRIQQWAGHTDFQTTQGYLVTADAVGRDNFGEPFPELPVVLLSGEYPAQYPADVHFLAEKWRSGRDSKAGFSIAFSDNSTELVARAPESLALKSDVSARKVTARDDSDESKDDLGAVVGSALERVALLAAQAGRWDLAQRTLGEMARRGIGTETAAQVAELAAEAGEWSLADAALSAVSGV